VPRVPDTRGLPPNQIVRHVLNETNPGWLDHQDRCTRYDRAYDVYRGHAPNTTGLQPWQTKLFVKYGMQVIDQLLANLVQGAPKAVCKPRREQDVMAARAMEIVLGYFADHDHLAEKEQTVIAQALIYGVSPGKTHWFYREEQVKVPGGQLPVVVADRPSFTPWNVYDCWWDPYACDVDNASYIVLRDWLTKTELLDRQYSEDTGQGVYRNLDKLFSVGPGEAPPVTSQNKLLTQPTNPYKDRFEILEIWRNNRVTVIGNRQVLLADGPSPYWMPGKPIVISNSRPDLFKIEGISETELVDHLQQALHMVTNLRMDNLKFTVNRGATYRESGIVDPDRLVIRPHFLWPVTDHDDIKWQDPPALPREAYQEEETLLGRMQYITGVSPYVTGASSTGTGVDQDTATGVTLLHESASRLLAFKANQIRLKTWQRTFEQWAELTKQFLTDQLAVAIEGPGNKTTWVELGPQEIMGDYDVRIQAGEESLSRQQERAEAIGILNALAPFAQAGLVNLQPLLEKVAFAYDMPDRTSLLPAPQQQQPPASPTMNGQIPQAPTPFSLGNGVTPQPPQAVLAGNAR
jgi:hypothetical protein